MKSQEIKKVTAYCAVCGEKCGKGMTTFEKDGKTYHACSGFHNNMPCRAFLQLRLEPAPKDKPRTRNRSR
ncbi:hypothetical protein V0M98_34385 (plasmid) [Pseudomonas silesiensis]|uniref:hypothetical protein n=1 Tax=Pseudomonas silesiensis TaxID=1853130 RepID=UPI0030CC0E52